MGRLNKTLSAEFYQRDTQLVAKELLGKTLVRNYRGLRLAGKIVETEAYLGVSDPACHTYKNLKSPRTEAMYMQGGHAYIYFIYGIHYCLNAVTRDSQTPEAVLIRALEPLDGIEQMKTLRNCKEMKNLTNGPGKLCQALKIDKSQNKIPLWKSKELFIEVGDSLGFDIYTTKRVGVDYAGEAKNWPLRFYIQGSKFISKK